MTYLAGASHDKSWFPYRSPFDLTVKYRSLHIGVYKHLLNFHRIANGANDNTVPTGIEDHPYGRNGIEGKSANVPKPPLKKLLPRHIVIGVGKADIPVLEARIEDNLIQIDASFLPFAA